ncbi:MAG TPA: hypothetical protein PLM62_11710, partial [Zoogloea sp.]|nr:hypothetical protein [Zoogloea sp.]
HSAIAVPTVKYFFKSLFFNRKIDSHGVRTMIGGCVWNTTKGPALSGRAQTPDVSPDTRQQADNEIQSTDVKGFY